MLFLSVCGLLLLTGGSSHAEEIPQFSIPPANTAIHIKYTIYTHWLPVMKLDTSFLLEQTHYNVALQARAEGLLSIFTKLRIQSVATGAIRDDSVLPSRYDSQGLSRSAQRHVVLDYPQGQPVVTLLEPKEDDREPVPDALRQRGADILTTMAKVILKVRQTGHCDGTHDVFDGIRVSHFTLKTAGQDMQPDVFQNRKIPAMRCEFIGYQTAGFIKGHQAKALREPHGGTVWFINVDGYGPVPVRTEIDHPKVGHLTVKLDKLEKGAG
ncbi:DUF3108 domain-containing protein [Acetobacter sp.]|jgi:hypothetical protein|uniref:DUF3108 domain-containing protein n=1 Tax=Acetobacter sp. TaxID=440 RepID=UPI0025C6E1E1|nr:DUF3108 domain-containing protein [Acetobacter sp.]MCH4090709.1 DUF3108 domain-containing protein [Acetobacter sp.]MCI1300152.1 DUF3108 domain-containing protein [Acetobacter sp.]MCI1316570.1 DUF3108 domain-containing protein [Acetobacter sp.]